VVREQDRVIPRKCPWGHVRSRRVVPRRVVRPAPPGTVASGDSGPASTRSMPASSRCTEAERRASGSTPVRGLAARVDAPRISSPVLRRRRTRFGACRAAHPAPVAGTRCGRGRCPAQAVSPVTSVQSASVRPLAKGPRRRSIFRHVLHDRLGEHPESGRRTGRECGHRCILGSCVGSAYMGGQP